MANVNGGALTNQVQEGQAVATVKGLLANVNYKKRFEEILGKKAAGFISSVINISNSQTLKGCEPNSIVSAAVVAATLDLPIDPNLGLAYIVPYNDKKRGKIAQFQLGYKSFIQLAMRSGQYKTISSSEVYEGEIKKYNRITGEIEFNEDFTPDENSKIVGYIAYFKLLNGFEKYLYMKVEQLQAHGKKFSQSYKSTNQWVRENSLWNTDFNSMATKTVLKLLLSKYGILSLEMQTAINADQAIVKETALNDNADVNESFDYADNPNNSIDAEFTPVDEKDEFAGTPFSEEK